MTPARRLASGLDLLPPARTRPLGRLEALGLTLRAPDRAGLGRRNRLSNFTFFLFAAAGGSAASVVAAILASWALISLLARRFPFRLARSDRPVVLASLLFFAVFAASAVLRPPPGGTPHLLAAIGQLLPFAMPLVLVPRMRLSRFADTLPPAFAGAAVGGLALIPIVAVDFVLYGERVKGLAGNSGPLSICGLLAAGWALLHLSRRRGRAILCLLGAFGGSAAVVMSGMRGAWPALPLVLLVAALARRREIAALWDEAGTALRLLVAVLAFGALGALAVVAVPLVGARLGAMWSELTLILADVDSSTSLNMRKEMYEGALQAIAARPLFGYGDGGHWEAIRPFLNPAAFNGVEFTHLHNVVLTVGVDAGLVGVAALALLVAAPLWTAVRARRLTGGTRRLAAALILVLAFLLPGMTNIMLFHDILDAVFVFAISLIAASVPDEAAA